MARYPIYNFNDPNLDYSTVENTVNQMYSDCNSQYIGCCKPKKWKEVSYEVSGHMYAAKIDKNDLNDIVRYNNDIMISYKMLFDFINFK